MRTFSSSHSPHRGFLSRKSLVVVPLIWALVSIGKALISLACYSSSSSVVAPIHDYYLSQQQQASHENRYLEIKQSSKSIQNSRQPVSFSLSSLSTKPRGEAKDAKMTVESAAICCIQKEEDLYLDEWVDYHLGLGFSDIYIYDNSDEGLQGWLEDYVAPNENENEQANTKTKPKPKSSKARKLPFEQQIHVIPFPGNKKQIPAYKDCARRVRDRNHTWVSFLDVDEFLVLKQHDNVVDFAREYAPPGHQLSLNWQIFGTSQRTMYEPWPVTYRFQCRVNWSKNSYFKVLAWVQSIDINRIKSPHNLPVRNHRIETTKTVLLKDYNKTAKADTGRTSSVTSKRIGKNGEESVTTRTTTITLGKNNTATQTTTTSTMIIGKRVDTDGNLIYSSRGWGPRDVAVIYHYYYRSFEEHVNKRERGDVFYGSTHGRDDFARLAKLGYDPLSGHRVQAGSIWDDTAWRKLVEFYPEKYARYEDPTFQPKESPRCKVPTGWELKVLAADLTPEQQKSQQESLWKTWRNDKTTKSSVRHRSLVASATSERIDLDESSGQEENDEEARHSAKIAMKKISRTAIH